MSKENYEKEIKQLQKRLEFEDIVVALIADVEETLRNEKIINNKEKKSD